jgi:hypothetical protein
MSCNHILHLFNKAQSREAGAGQCHFALTHGQQYRVYGELDVDAASTTQPGTGAGVVYGHIYMFVFPEPPIVMHSSVEL